MGFPVWDQALVYNRDLILSGEIWRCWTGHVVHFGFGHFFWDMAIFVPAGCWLERLQPRRTRWFYLVCPPVLSAAFLAFEPSLDLYAGISGVATGVLVLLAGLQLRRPSEPAWLWWSVLLVVGLKIVVEHTSQQPLMIDLPGGIRVVSLAHIGGLICGLAFLFARPSQTIATR